MKDLLHPIKIVIRRTQWEGVAVFRFVPKRKLHSLSPMNDRVNKRRPPLVNHQFGGYYS